MKKEILILAVIVIFGLALRLYGLTSTSLYGDELTLVYDAYSILKTGHDQTGQFLPITFRMAEGRPAAYVYLSIPFVALFGPSILAARFLSLLSGLGIIILMFYLGKKLVNEKVGLLAAGLAAISPWDLQMSHGGFETHFALFLTLSAVVSFLNAGKKPYLLFISALSLGLAINTYSTYKLTVPLMAITLLWYGKNFKLWFKKPLLSWTIVSFAVLLLTVGVLISQMLTAKSETRFLNINIFNQPKLKEAIVQNINLERSMTAGPALLPSIFQNKAISYSLIFADNYLQNFSMDFLFLHGDHNPRHNGATLGQFYLVELILMILGLIFLASQKPSALKLIIPWLLIAPLPSALTGEPHALRGSLMLPPLIFLSAVGAFFLIQKLQQTRRNFLIWLIGLVLITEFLLFSGRFYFLAPNQFSRFWSDPAKLASETIAQNKNQFAYIIVSDSLDNIEFAYPTYTKIDPKIVISQNLERVTLNDLSFKKFDNVYIGHVPGGDIEQFMQKLNGSVLFIGTSEEARYLQNYDSILGKDHLTAFVTQKMIR